MQLGLVKNSYRSRPLQDKKTKEGFKNLVKNCVSRDCLTAERIRKVSRRAQAHILACCVLEDGHWPAGAEATGNGSEMAAALAEGTNGQITLSKLEGVMKLFKTHRTTLHWDQGFINAFLRGVQRGV